MISLDEKNKIVKDINPNITILSEKRIKQNGYNYNYCKCICSKDGEVWESLWSNLSRGKGCPTCGIKKRNKKRRKVSLTEIDKKINKFGFKLLTKEEYKNRNQKLDIIDEKGYKIQTTYQILHLGCKPSVFSDKNPYTIDNIKLWLKLNNSKYKLISIKYINNRKHLKFLCPIHGEFEMSWGHIQQGKGCKYCKIDKFKGENNPNWNGGKTPLKEYLRGVITEWKKDTIKKCKYKCVVTQDKFDDIHHLYGFDKILDEILKITKLPIYQEINLYSEKEIKLLEKVCIDLHYKYGLGVCLRHDVHVKFHSIYGFGGNTPQQFKEFLKSEVAA